MTAGLSRRVLVAVGASLLVVLSAGCGQGDPQPTATKTPLTAREGARIVARCLLDKGWAVKADESSPGNIVLPGDGIPAEQSDAYVADSDACHDLLGEDFVRPMTPELAKMMYAHYLTSKTCLEGLGFTISEPTTEAVFVAEFTRVPTGDFWRPYAELPDDLSAERFAEIERACPQNPVEITG